MVGAFWGLTSSLLLACLHKWHKPTRFPSPQECVYTKQNGEAFVDDMTLWILMMTGTLTALVLRMTNMAQTWEQLLWTSGGALNLKKCYWFLVSWKWTKTGKPKMQMIAEMHGFEIRLMEGSDQTKTVKITRKEVTQGQQTLGTRLCPSGLDKMELAHRMEQGKELRKRLMKAPINEEETRLGFWMFCQAIEYVLPMTCFTKAECKKIQGTYLPTFLAKMGIQ